MIRSVEKVWIIASKDLRNLFLSPLFWVVSGLCCLAWTLIYITSIQEFASQVMQNAMMAGARGGAEQGGPNLHFTVFSRHISLTNLFMIFAIAAISMRLFSEEKKSRSYDLLLTAPVTSTQIVLGKLVAGLLSAWALVALSLLYPMSLALFSEIEWGPLISSYIGLLLITGCYVGFGMFASSLTENSTITVVASLIFSVMLWFVGVLGDLGGGTGWAPFFEHLNVGNHFFNYIRGTFSVASTVFFASVIFLAAFLTQRVVESSRWR
jgi:ABC-2 type transport system permease protein